MRLGIASLFTLGLLFCMLFAIVFTAFYVAGFIEWYFLIGTTLVMNFFLWLVSPYISDFIYQWFYKVNWVGIEGLKARNLNIGIFVESIAKKYNMPIPKIGWIPDDNPTAFCYGSGRFNSRLIYTEGIFRYLDEEEAKSVFAHELGHIVHRDFIVMTVAATALQLLYELYFVFTRVRGSGKGAGILKLIGIASYVFYFIGTYILLYLSRIREYYADEFSALETKNPNALSTALVKVAYGIIANKDTEEEERLIKSTRALGLVDYKYSKELGLIYTISKKLKSDVLLQKLSLKAIESIFLYDLKNPWAFFIELSSTHPRTAKRIEKLEKIAKQFGQIPTFNIENIKNFFIDRERMWKNFFADLIFNYLPAIALVLAVLGVFLALIFSIHLPLAIIFLVLGVSLILQTMYKYPSKPSEEITILDAMCDLYASPIRGRAVKFKGKIIGRGIPGLIFSEDMMMQDVTGLMYLNYQSLIPLFGNLIFAFTKLDSLIGKEVKVEGWFLRGLSSRLELKKIYYNNETIDSHVKTLGIIIGVLFLVIGIFKISPKLL